MKITIMQQCIFKGLYNQIQKQIVKTLNKPWGNNPHAIYRLSTLTFTNTLLFSLISSEFECHSKSIVCTFILCQVEHTVLVRIDFYPLLILGKPYPCQYWAASHETLRQWANHKSGGSLVVKQNKIEVKETTSKSYMHRGKRKWFMETQYNQTVWKRFLR